MTHEQRERVNVPRDVNDLNRETQAIWDAKAEYWDTQMGEGNVFHRQLVGPSAERLLSVTPGERVLEIACGNGQFARRLAALGAQVHAIDFSARFLDLARSRTHPHPERITFQQVDVTDASQLLALGEGQFDAAVCLMALMDIATIDPLLSALPRLLRPGGRFVFVIPHPCFNSNGIRLSLEGEDRGGDLIETYAVKVIDYLHVPPGKGAGMPGEPMPHYYFHRPLHELLNAFFQHGFVLDGIEEPAFDGSVGGSRPLSWLNFEHVPPAFAARLRVVARV